MLSYFNKSVVGLLVAVACSVAFSGAASAQWIDKPEDLDPFNRNSAINRAGRDLDSKRLDAMQGAPYVVTLRNPNPNGINFRINGVPYLVLGHQQITIRGRGTPEITFDYGLGDGSYRSYRLSSGRTYVFRWKLVSLASPYGPRELLNLYGG